MIGAAALEWEKIYREIPLHETYILDTQEKTDPRNTARFLLSHGKALLFSSTVLVDPPWDDSAGEDLVKIIRSKFKELGSGRGQTHEVMGFVCSDSCKNGITKGKVRHCVRKVQANHLFQSISGSKAMDWNFQSVKYLDELVQQYGGRKSGGREAVPRKDLKRMSMPAAWREFCGFRIPLPVRISRWPARL